MSNTTTTPAPRRTLLQWLFGCGLGRNLVTVWVTEVGQYAHGQTETDTKIILGRYTVLRWTKIYTPAND